jgi:hypothetical protein
MNAAVVNKVRQTFAGYGHWRPGAFSNTIGRFNTATGEGALFSNSTGGDNTANGLQAL